MKFYSKLIFVSLFIIPFHIYAQQDGFYLQLNPQISIVNNYNLKVYENTNHTPHNPTLSQTNPGIKIGISRRMHLKNNYALSIGLSISNFKYRASHTLNGTGFTSYVDQENRFGILDLSVSLTKAIPVFKKSSLILDMGVGCCLLMCVGGTGISDWYHDPSIPFSLMLDVNWDPIVTSPEVHCGIRLLNPHILKNRLEFGLSYSWIINDIPGLQLNNVFNGEQIKYTISPNLSMLSIDLIYKLSPNLNEINHSRSYSIH